MGWWMTAVVQRGAAALILLLGGGSGGWRCSVPTFPLGPSQVPPAVHISSIGNPCPMICLGKLSLYFLSLFGTEMFIWKKENH